MSLFACPYLQGEVEWTQERERHTAERHPDLLPQHRDKVAVALADPEQVRRSKRFGNARLFSRWYPELHDGKHLVAVVVTDPAPALRHWLVTAYIARRLVEGEVEWTRS